MGDAKEVTIRVTLKIYGVKMTPVNSLDFQVPVPFWKEDGRRTL